MSLSALEELFRRLSSDAQFKARFQADPDGVLSGFELTEEERQAVKKVHSGGVSGHRKMTVNSKSLLEPWLVPELEAEQVK